MASTDSHSNHGSEIPCPDPSVHEKHDRLSAQASTAALYVTQPHKGTDPREPKQDPLGKDGKLSSKSAATSLKYAKATDLPSFPSHGGESNAAGAAAMLAKDYKMKDLWQPEASMAGSKAAVKAQKEGGKLDLWEYQGSKNGLSAATLAMRKNKESPLSPNIDRGYTDAGKSNSLLAATKSTKSSRQRSDSTPIRPAPLYPDEKNSARNALNAATVSHRASVRAPPKEDGWNSEANQAARIKNSHMDRDMFGSNPQVEPEVEEQKHQAALRASAVSMAKKMYDVQNRAMLANASDGSNIGSAGAETAHKRNASAISQPDLKREAMQYITLQDQAQKLAQERLAKVDKEMENSKYREYYGYGDKSPRRSRLSMRGRQRNRAASEGADNSDSDDEQQARRIRTQMSQLSTASNTVSDKQRDDDRARLLKAAEKRVHDRMHEMDEKVFTDTGKPTQAMMDDWEAKAQAKAEKDAKERERHPGKTHIGGGKYMDQSEIEAIAAARLKPTLDQLDENAKLRREREAEIARKQDVAHTEQMEEKMRNEDQKAEFKRIKEQDKAAARKEKDERKAREREEKLRKSEDQRKSRDMKRPAAGAVAGGAAAGTGAEPAEEPQQDVKDKRKSRGMFGRLADKFRGDEKPATATEKSEDKPTETTTKDEHNDASKMATAGAGVGGATAGGLASDKAVTEDNSMYDVSNRDAEGAREAEPSSEFESTGDRFSSTADRKDDEDELQGRDSHPGFVGTLAAATAGVGATSAGAGAVGWATTRTDPDTEEREAVSDLVTDSDDGDLQPVETAHSMQPLQSPEVNKRPDLERHITTIDTSSGEEDSDDLSDSDDEERGRGRTGGQGGFLTTSRSETAPAAEEPVSPLADQDEPPTIAPMAKGEDKQRVPAPAPIPASKEKHDDEIAPDEQAPATSTEKTEPAAAAPIVATGPSTTDSKAKEPEKPKEEKKEGGLRGLFSRLKGGNKDTKSDGKLHKNRSGSDAQQEKGFQGGAKYTGAGSGSDSITPVTTTSAGKSAEAGTTDSGDKNALPVHQGTDGPIGDPEARAAVASNAGVADTNDTASTSSFKRHGTGLRDTDDVSSSGAEEEDVERGRSGRNLRTIGSGGYKDDDEASTAEVRKGVSAAGGDDGDGSEEQFEEARDHFDEGLAPPPAFAGQPKSQSPVRETKFTERF